MRGCLLQPKAAHDDVALPSVFEDINNPHMRYFFAIGSALHDLDGRQGHSSKQAPRTCTTCLPYKLSARNIESSMY